MEFLERKASLHCGRSILRSCIIHHMNPGTNNCFKIQFLKTQTLRTGQILICMIFVRAMKQQKREKSPGPDGIPMEAFIFGGKKLHLHLSLLFNLFLHHVFLPDIFCQAVIIPLVKCKTGDLSDVNNYRAIAISTAVSKILEHILLDLLQVGEVADQLGFKKPKFDYALHAGFKANC